MKFKNFPTWLKGGVIGGCIGLVLLIINLFDTNPNTINRFLEILFVFFLIFLIPSVLVGIFIGFFSSRIKNKSILIGGLVGLFVGVFSFLVIENTQIGKIFLLPAFSIRFIIGQFTSVI